MRSCSTSTSKFPLSLEGYSIACLGPAQETKPIQTGEENRRNDRISGVRISEFKETVKTEATAYLGSV